MSAFNPRILEYDDGVLSIADDARFIPEIKDIIDKYPGKGEADPYLAYVQLMTDLESPYVSLPEADKSDTIIFDVQKTVGPFDPFDPLLKAAVQKLESLYDSEAMRFFKSLKIAIDKMGKYLRDEEITSGRDGNLSEIIRILKESGSSLKSLKEIQKQVEEETNLRGSQEAGEY